MLTQVAHVDVVEQACLAKLFDVVGARVQGLTALPAIGNHDTGTLTIWILVGSPALAAIFSATSFVAQVNSNRRRCPASRTWYLACRFMASMYH